MSDSEQFEDLTNQVYASKMKSNLKTSKLNVSRLVNEKEEMMMKITQLTRALQKSQKQIESKNSMLNTITRDQIRLSKKLLILQQQKIQLKQDLLKTEKHYQNIMGQLLKEKQQLLSINKELSDNLIRLEEQRRKEKEKSEQNKRQIQDQNQKLKQSLCEIGNQLQLTNKRLSQQVIETAQATAKITQHYKSQYQQLLNSFQAFKLQSSQQSFRFNQQHQIQVNQLKIQFEQMKYESIVNQSIIQEKDQLKMRCQMLEKRVDQILSQCNRLGEQKKDLIDEIDRITQQNMQQHNHLQLEVKLLQQENHDSLEQITRLNQLINQAKQQIKGQLPSAEILFLVDKFLKLNRQQSFIYMKQCQLSQQDRSYIQQTEIEDLIKRIHQLLHQNHNSKKNNK